MKIPNKPSIILIVTIVSFSVAATLSYINFTKYQPKVLKKIEEVKGIKIVNDIELLYPENVEKISSSQTEFGTHATYKISKTQDQMRFFYKNLLTDLGWEEDSIKIIEDSMVYKFKKEGKLATIITQTAENTTLVSLEISKR